MDSGIKPIVFNEFSFRWYKKLVQNILTRDNRELNYQNRVIIPMLEKLFINTPDIDIVDVSTLYKNWNRRIFHDRAKYAGDYTPDILVAKNWDIKNKGNTDIKYLCLIEVKVPTSKDFNHAQKEVKEYLQKVEHVILTDTITWEFYDRKNEMPKIYSLEKPLNTALNRVCKRGENKEIAWELGDDFSKEQSGSPDSTEKEPKNWKEIICEITSLD